MTDEDKRLILERCGIVFMEEKGYHGWYRGFGSQGLEWVADELNLDLNFYFEYAVPEGASVLLSSRNNHTTCILSIPAGKFGYGSKDYTATVEGQKKYAEAFGQALLKLIKDIHLSVVAE